jgi:hypothetical protein
VNKRPYLSSDFGAAENDKEHKDTSFVEEEIALERK